MDCSVCHLRSAVGYCVACQALVCEQCGVACHECGKLVCPTHVEETRHHHFLCPNCTRERAARQAQRLAERKRAESDSEGHPHPSEKTGRRDTDDKMLLESRYQEWEPWQLSLLCGALSAVAVLLMFVPLFHGVLTPWFAGVGLVMAALAVAWALVGVLNVRYRKDRKRCCAGLGIALAALGVLAIAFMHRA